MCNETGIGAIDTKSESLPFEHDYTRRHGPSNSACPNMTYFNVQGCWLLKCVICGQQFYARRPDRKYCSRTCNHSAAKQRLAIQRKLKRQKTCFFCGCSFEAKSAKACFCSLKHRVAYFRSKKRNDSNLRVNKHKVETVTEEGRQLLKNREVQTP